MPKKSSLFLWGMAILWGGIATTRELPPPVADGLAFDSFHRVTSAAGKQPVVCPEQDAATAVILTIGQSNAANYATRAYHSTHGDKVLNFFGGKCYLAGSPLLGADGPWGEYWTEVANRLVQAGRYHRVVLVSSAIGGSDIAQWQSGGRLNAMLMNVLTEVRPHYRVTHVLWHQGESDSRTSAVRYRTSFMSLVESLRSRGIAAPIFVSVTSSPPLGVQGVPEVVQAQRELPDPRRNILAGVDTNALIQRSDRNSTGHFAESGQRKVITAWLEILLKR